MTKKRQREQTTAREDNFGTIEVDGPDTSPAPPISEHVTDTGQSPAEIMGHVNWLMMKSSAHKHIFVSDFEWLIVPPITLKQFRIYMSDNTPFAFATWARLSEEAEARLKAGQRRLSPADWNSGERLWLIDLLAPFGGTEGILRELSKTVFPNEEFRTLVPGENGEGLRVLKVGGDGTAEPKKRKSATKKSAAKKTSAKKKAPAKRTRKANGEAKS